MGIDKKQRNAVLESNKKLRDGIESSRTLDDGFVEFRFPSWFEIKSLMIKYPGLASTDADERRKAWNEFRWSADSEPYRVVRSPLQVRRDQKRGVIIR